MHSETPSPPCAPGKLRVALALALTSFLVFVANWRLISAGDNYPARYLPFAILGYRTLYLDPVARVAAQGDTHPYWLMERYGRLKSAYPIVVPALATPLYLPAVAYLTYRGWTEARLDRVARLMEKLTSALIASLSVGAMALLLGRRATPKLAVLLTVAYALGTNTWMIGSQALWQHGMAQLLLVLALLLVTGSPKPGRALAAGAVCGLLVCNRPPDALLALALGLYAAKWSRRDFPCFALGALLPLGLLLAYNLHFTHSLVGGYATKGDLGSFRFDLFSGVLGLLFSPARGLFVFSPFLLFLPLGLPRVLRDARFRWLDLPLLAAVVAQLGLYAKLDWRAGCSWGPRWLTDLLPILVWLLPPALCAAGRLTRAAFLLAVCVSIGIQAIGAFWYTGKSDERIFSAAEADPNRSPVLWDPRSAPFLVELTHPPAGDGVMFWTDGDIDSVKMGGRAADVFAAGPELTVEGWTLTEGRAPAEVRVELQPEGDTRWRGPGSYVTVTTASFSSPGSRWRVALPTGQLDPGLHRIQLRARSTPGGEFHPVAERPVVALSGLAAPGPVDDPGQADLARWAGLAARRIEARQRPDGVWLTSHTHTPRFENSTVELNTFLVAMMFDLLAPAKRRAGLDDCLARAQRYLGRQIEESGLARYHGRPDAVSPSLGCVITPDADDTALAWRIAGDEKSPLLARALAELDSYRTPEGLYRTWLAPREQFVSIDPGDDPNPPDIAIQMHVLMFLARFAPRAAEELHRALDRTADDKKDRAWVYYRKAPLVPVLRQGELRAMGYAVRLRKEAKESCEASQGDWLLACQMLASYLAGGKPPLGGRAARAVLKALAANDFALVGTNPPLLYHNDLTARVSRYYWSEDFGYALWLRLWHETAKRRN